MLLSCLRWRLLSRCEQAPYRSAAGRWLLALTALVLTAGAAAAPDAAPAGAVPPMSVSIHRDAPAQAPIEAVLGLAFESIRLPLSRGSTTAVTWLRLEVPPSAETDVVLMTLPQQLDDVRLYQAHPQGGWRESRGGDRVAYSQRERHELYPAFNVRLNPERPTVMYLRMQTTSVHVLNVKLMTGGQASAWDAGLQLVLGLFLGALLLFAISSTVRWFVSRNPLWIAGALFQWQSVWFVGCFMGLGARYVWPQSPALVDFLTSLGAVLNYLLGTLFYALLFVRLRVRRGLLAVQVLFVLAGLWALYLVLRGQTLQALSVNNTALGLSSLGGMVVMWFFQPEDLALRRMVRGAYALTVAFVAYFTLPFVTPFPASEIHMFPALPAIALLAVTQFLIAMREDWLRRQQAEALQQQMRIVQLNYEIEQRQHAQTAHFMSMLLHELKNPLAAIRLAAQSIQRLVSQVPDVIPRVRNIERAVQGIDQVLERCRDLDRVAGGNLSIQLQRVDLCALLPQWVANSKQAERLRTVAPPAGSWVQTDPMLLDLMVNNLLDNALKYSPPDSVVDVVVELRAYEQPLRFSIEVRNTVGQAGRPDPERLFTRYYRADAAHHLSGSGLGLSWVHGVAQQMNGRVTYQALGEQVVFTLELPC